MPPDIPPCVAAGLWFLCGMAAQLEKWSGGHFLDWLTVDDSGTHATVRASRTCTC